MFALSWLGLSMTELNDVQVVIYAVAITAVSAAACLFLWQSGGILDTTDPRVVIVVVFFGIGGVAASLLLDALIAGVNLFDPLQWAGLWKSGGIFGFVITVFGAGAIMAIAVATATRVAILRAYWALTPASTPTRAEATRAGDTER